MKNLLYTIIFVIPLLVSAGTYDASLLQIGSKIFPKIVLIEKGTKDRVDSSIQLVIVASSLYQENAQSFSKLVQAQYPQGINGHPLRITIVSPKEGLNIDNAHGFILMLSPNDRLLEPLINHANENKILTFSFDPSLLSSGVLISLYIGKTVKPYLNIATLKHASFQFDYSFISLSILYE